MNNLMIKLFSVWVVCFYTLATSVGLGFLQTIIRWWHWTNWLRAHNSVTKDSRGTETSFDFRAYWSQTPNNNVLFYCTELSWQSMALHYQSRRRKEVGRVGGAGGSTGHQPLTFHLSPDSLTSVYFSRLSWSPSSAASSSPYRSLGKECTGFKKKAYSC